ncbi:MAG: hypothetical protein OS130_00610 [Thermodesulfobacteriota bacterium]|jgi:hypothetical protein|nr:MAG: hypothetical protein OS130_00610 [Thermodesulfobacteriota bacterium]
MGITKQTYLRWRMEYGGMKTIQVKRIKDLEREKGRLKKAMAEFIVDKQILKEALEGNYYKFRQAPALRGTRQGENGRIRAASLSGDRSALVNPEK